MFVFLKSQASSIISTAVDFVVTFLLKQLLGDWFVLASITGNIAGGIVNFMLGRNWVFSSRENGASEQFVKYTLVWLGNLALNAAGIYFFKEILKLEDWTSKVLTSIIVGIGYNYVFQRFFVFRKPATQVAES